MDSDSTNSRGRRRNTTGHRGNRTSPLTSRSSAMSTSSVDTSFVQFGPSQEAAPYEAFVYGLQPMQGGHPPMSYPPPSHYPPEGIFQHQLSPPQSPPQNFPWPGHPSAAPQSHRHLNASQLLSPYSGAHPLQPHQQPYTSTGLSASQGASTSAAGSSGRSSPPEGEELTEAERIAITDDKRRRNTAASARFRSKKKQRALNLERSVSDLTGRAEELEREAAELKMENGWLKEIVVLKGARFPGAASNTGSPQAEEGSGDEDDTKVEEGSRGRW